MNTKKGFTLVELLVVIAIVAVVLSLIVGIFRGGNGADDKGRPENSQLPDVDYNTIPERE